METVCYVCNEKSKEWHRNLIETKTKHSQTPVKVFIEKLLKQFESHRDLDDESNCICSMCLMRFHAYDWTCLKAKEQEKKLRLILEATETDFIEQHSKILRVEDGKEQSDDENDTIYLVDVCSSDDEGGGGREEDIVVSLNMIENADQTTDAEVELEMEIKFNNGDEGESESKATIAAEREVEILTENEIKIEANPLDDMDSPNEEISEKNEMDLNLPTISTAISSSTKPIMVRLPKRTGAPAVKTISYGVFDDIGICNEDSLRRYFNELPPKKDEPEKFLCLICNKRFRQDVAEKHLHWHTQNPFECHLCGYIMSNKTIYEEHLDKHKTVAKFQCVICGKQSKEKQKMQIHTKRLHNEKGFLCDLCGNKYSLVCDMEKHRRTHFKEPSMIKCPHCEKKYTTTDSLKYHIRIVHEGLKGTFKCIHCKMPFNRKSQCRLHERRHVEDTKKYKCSICPAAFELKHDFNLHLQRKHNVAKHQK